MEIKQLRFFIEIARRLSFTRAAETLHIAQPALSTAIRKLEDELGLTLFNRSDRKIALTAEGETFLRHATAILDDVRKAEREMADIRGLTAGEVRVGVTPMLSTYFFPKIIAGFTKRHPALQLSVYGDSAARIQRMVAGGELDMGVVAGAALPESLEYHHLLHEEIVACVPAHHPLARRKAVPFTELLREPLILFKEGYHLRELIDETAARFGAQPRTVFESNLFTLIRNLVREGLGISFLLRMVVADEKDLVALRCDPPLHLDLFIAWKRQAGLSRANRAFADYLIDQTDEYYRLSEMYGSFPLP